jgi:hypothetical protein
MQYHSFFVVSCLMLLLVFSRAASTDEEDDDGSDDASRKHWNTLGVDTLLSDPTNLANRILSDPEHVRIFLSEFGLGPFIQDDLPSYMHHNMTWEANSACANITLSVQDRKLSSLQPAETFGLEICLKQKALQVVEKIVQKRPESSDPFTILLVKSMLNILQLQVL